MQHAWRAHKPAGWQAGAAVDARVGVGWHTSAASSLARQPGRGAHLQHSRLGRLPGVEAAVLGPQAAAGARRNGRLARAACRRRLAAAAAAALLGRLACRRGMWARRRRGRRVWRVPRRRQAGCGLLHAGCRQPRAAGRPRRVACGHRLAQGAREAAAGGRPHRQAPLRIPHSQHPAIGGPAQDRGGAHHRRAVAPVGQRQHAGGLGLAGARAGGVAVAVGVGGAADAVPAAAAARAAHAEQGLQRVDGHAPVRHAQSQQLGRGVEGRRHRRRRVCADRLEHPPEELQLLRRVDA